jgi:hypothetical protein
MRGVHRSAPRAAHDHGPPHGHVVPGHLVMRDDPVRRAHRVAPWLAAASPPQGSWKMFHMCWAPSDGSSKLIPIDEQPNHQVVSL